MEIVPLDCRAFKSRVFRKDEILFVFSIPLALVGLGER